MKLPIEIIERADDESLFAYLLQQKHGKADQLTEYHLVMDE